MQAHRCAGDRLELASCKLSVSSPVTYKAQHAHFKYLRADSSSPFRVNAQNLVYRLLTVALGVGAGSGEGCSKSPRSRPDATRRDLQAQGDYMSKLISFFADESGASAAEYALILAIVGVGIVTAATGLKNAISTAMNSASSSISSS